MKIVLYTQRVEVIESYNERRDCADQDISRFIFACGYLPIAVPNIKEQINKLVETLQPVGIILTGGNSLVKYGGDAPERDETEKELLNIAIEKDIPVYGFCRGMQMILDYFGNSLENVLEHVAVKHVLKSMWGQIEVNSYHNQACKNVLPPIKVLAKAEDGVIEAIEYPQRNILATMWHPEREKPFKLRDISMVQNLFEKRSM